MGFSCAGPCTLGLTAQGNNEKKKNKVGTNLSLWVPDPLTAGSQPSFHFSRLQENVLQQRVVLFWPNAKASVFLLDSADIVARSGAES